MISEGEDDTEEEGNEASNGGTHFTHFTSTKVQNLTPEEVLKRARTTRKRARRSGKVKTGRGSWSWEC